MSLVFMRPWLAGWLLMLSIGSHAVVEGHKYQFDNEDDLQRFQVLAEELRCPKCQNQNLADSNSPVASDLRDKVYELMQDGQSDQAIIDYLVARYGDFVYYKPPMRGDTLVLWFAPLLVFLIGILVLWNIRRGNRQREITALTPEEQARLKALREQADKGDDT